MAGTIGLAMLMAPLPARAAPDPGTASGAPADTAAASSPAEPSAEAPAEPSAEASTERSEPANDVAADEAEAEDPEADEAEAGEAEADEAETDEAETENAPSATAEPLPPMQTAAWWTMFGAFAIGTTAGVLAGLVERQEDRATRLSTLFDAETGSQPLYADRQEEYEQYLRRGQAYARAAIGVGAVAGAATIAAIALFAIDAKRQRKERAPASARVRVRPLLGGVKVRF